MSNVPTCITDGERGKITAFALLAARRQALIRSARRALLAVLLERGEATADDVRVAVPLPPGVGPHARRPLDPRAKLSVNPSA